MIDLISLFVPKEILFVIYLIFLSYLVYGQEWNTENFKLRVK